MIKLIDILFENHPLSAEVQKLEDDLKVKYPSIDKLGIYMDKRKNSLFGNRPNKFKHTYLQRKLVVLQNRICI
jgi:hypothetical protein